jgi:hypothetical protein
MLEDFINESGSVLSGRLGGTGLQKGTSGTGERGY